MRVNFRSSDAFMAQHFLYGAQICPALNQMGCKWMPKSVWAYGFVCAGKQG